MRGDGVYHLVLNPDVILASDALVEGLGYLAAHPTVGMVAPEVRGPGGERQFLCKRYPSVLVLALRGFAPEWLRCRFRRRVDRFEIAGSPGRRAGYRNSPSTADASCSQGEPRSGRSAVSLAPLFLCFRRLRPQPPAPGVADIAYVPAVQILHSGGEAARKGRRRQLLFFRSPRSRSSPPTDGSSGDPCAPRVGAGNRRNSGFFGQPTPRGIRRTRSGRSGACPPARTAPAGTEPWVTGGWGTRPLTSAGQRDGGGPPRRARSPASVRRFGTSRQCAP